MQNTRERCLVTGATGYLGGRVAATLERDGWEVVELGRRRRPGAPGIVFSLGDEVRPIDLSGAKALVHCAYDFQPLTWSDIHRVNVTGTAKLLRAASEAAVERLVYISSISAFEGCRSLYGRAKFESERVALSLGAVVIRPALVFGDRPGAMFGRLVKQVERARVLPLVGGAQYQYLVHEQDLTEFICRCVERGGASPSVAVTIGHERPLTLRQLLEQLAHAHGRSVAFVPLPWQLVWAVIKAAEWCHVPMEFRSDSLVSLMYQDPSPDFGPMHELGITCRPFAWAPPTAASREAQAH